MKKNVRLVLLLAMIAVMLVVTAVFASAATIDVAADGNLADAVALAKPGDTINITGDITISKTITVSQDLAFTAAEGTTITVTVNGVGINVTAGTVTFDGLTMVRTKNNSNANGLIQATGDGAKAVINSGVYDGLDHVIVLSSANAELEINGGLFLGGGSGYGVYANQGRVTINGGIFEAYRCVSAIEHSNSIVTINGGEFHNNRRANQDNTNIFAAINGSGSSTWYINDCVVESSGIIFAFNNGCNVYINGGTYKVVKGAADDDYMFYISDGGAAVTINGGTFTMDGDLNTALLHKRNATAVNILGGEFVYNGTGYAFETYNGSIAGTLTIEEATISAASGMGVKIVAGSTVVIREAVVTSAGSAIDVAANEDGKTTTVKLISCDFASITDPSGVVVELDSHAKIFDIGAGAVSWEEAVAGVAANGTITVLGEVTWPLIVETDKAFVVNGGGYTIPTVTIRKGDVTFTNVKIVSDSKLPALEIVAGANAVVGEGCEISSATGAAIEAYGTLTVNGGTVTAPKSSAVNVYNDVTINGGTFTGTLAMKGGADDDFNELTINGGTFANNGTSGGHIVHANNRNCVITINGGTFTFAAPNKDTHLIRISDGTRNYIHIYGGSFNVTSGEGSVILKNGCTELVIGTKEGIPAPTFSYAGTGAAINLATAVGGLYMDGVDLNCGENIVDILIASAGYVDLRNAALGTVKIAENIKPTVYLLDCTVANPVNLDIANIGSLKVEYFEVNGTAYTWEAAQALLKAGDKVVLLGDVKFPVELNFDFALTFDFAGHSIAGFSITAGDVTLQNVALSTNSGTAALTIGEGVSISLGAGCVITSTSGKALVNNGTCVIDGAVITTTGNNLLIDNQGTMTIESGMFSGSIYAGGTMVINGGEFRHSGTWEHSSASSKRAPLVFMNSKGHLTINGGDFQKTNKEDKDGFPDAVIATNDSSSTIIINGGRFEALGDYGYVLNLASNDFLAINGGEIISGNTAYYAVNIGTMHGLSVDDRASTLKNFTVKGGAVGINFATAREWTFTVENVTVSDAAQAAIWLRNNSALTDVVIKSGSYSVSAEGARAVVVASGADLTIEGGTFRAEGTAAVICMSDSDVVSNVTVNGGSFMSLGTGAAVQIAQAAYSKKDNVEAGSYANLTGDSSLLGDLVINGGSFIARNAPVINHISIMAGSSADPEDETIIIPACVDVTVNGGTLTSSGDCVIRAAAHNEYAKILLAGGTLTLAGNTADAAVIKTVSLKVDYMQDGEAKSYDYGADCEIILDGAALVNANPTCTALILQADEFSYGVVTIKGGLMLSASTTGHFVFTYDDEIAIEGNSFAVNYKGATYYAYFDLAADEFAPATDAGASVRAELDSQGIRFTATIDAESVAALEALGEVTYGIVVAPLDFVINAGNFTIDALQAYAEEQGYGETPSKIYADIKAVNSLATAADGSVSFNGVIVNVKAANYARDLAAIAYACVDGTYYYGAFNVEDNVRNMAEVAAAALADVVDAADAANGYIYEVNGKYSKYTAEQCAALAVYCAG